MKIDLAIRPTDRYWLNLFLAENGVHHAHCRAHLPFTFLDGAMLLFTEDPSLQVSKRADLYGCLSPGTLVLLVIRKCSDDRLVRFVGVT